MREYKDLSLDRDSLYPTVCSFFTPDWEYPQWAERLVKNCKNLGLNYYISEYEDTKNYIRNCRKKPEHIQRVLYETEQPVLWIDVDGSIYKKPEIFKNCKFDFMAKMMPPDRERKWHVGTMFFNNTPTAIEFLDSWVEKTQTESGTDELILDVLWNRSDFSTRLTYSDIPTTYFIMKNKKYVPRGDDVIVHRISTGDSKMKMKIAKTYP